MSDILESVHSERDPEAAPATNDTDERRRDPGNHPRSRYSGGGYLGRQILQICLSNTTYICLAVLPDADPLHFALFYK